MQNDMKLCLWLLWCCVLLPRILCLLYPRESSNREVKELNGLWHFRADYSENRNEGFEKEWYKQPLSKTGDVMKMPVPSSFNDITQDPQLRDFVGWVWYDKEFWLPSFWSNEITRIMLRFESAHYNTIAWMNGNQFTAHSGGHLPFEGDVTSLVDSDRPNTLTVAINNTLGPHTLPPGSLSFYGPPDYAKSFFVQNVQVDFFNYAGLQRPVKLYTTFVAIHLDDITTTTTINSDGTATVKYSLEVGGTNSGDAVANVTLLNRVGDSVGMSVQSFSMCTEAVCSTQVTGSITVDKPELWWPWSMSSNPAYLYVFQVNVSVDGMTDLYTQPLGIRTVEVKDTQFLINDQPFYFHGVGKHEDADIRGKGLDYPLLVKDLNLLLWLGANSFRTSHYPYSEELMELCDQHGIVVIDETPAVGMKHEANFAQETLDHHIEVIHELVARDKNRPSVVMWSLANEPKSDLPVAQNYFKQLVEVTKQLDPTRPVTFASKKRYDNDLAAQYMDVISINRYIGWYQNSGHPETIYATFSRDLDLWYSRFKKPMLITEYGAGAVAGIHEDPQRMYSEEYQVEILANTFPVFDEYRQKFLIGEMVWNFADFQTAMTSKRVDGNKKGMLTRQREPKAAARLLRTRYHSLVQGIQLCYNTPLMGHAASYCPNNRYSM